MNTTLDLMQLRSPPGPTHVVIQLLQQLLALLPLPLVAADSAFLHPTAPHGFSRGERQPVPRGWRRFARKNSTLWRRLCKFPGG